jgi:hypothetical protein
MLPEKIQNEIDAIYTGIGKRINSSHNGNWKMRVETILNNEFSEEQHSEEELLIDWGNVKLIYKDKKIIGVQTFGGVISFDPADPSRFIIKKR